MHNDVLCPLPCAPAPSILVPPSLCPLILGSYILANLRPCAPVLEPFHPVALLPCAPPPVTQTCCMLALHKTRHTSVATAVTPYQTARCSESAHRTVKPPALQRTANSTVQSPVTLPSALPAAHTITGCSVTYWAFSQNCQNDCWLGHVCLSVCMGRLGWRWTDCHGIEFY